MGFICIYIFSFIINNQEKAQIQKDLWRIEDVTAGLSANKANYKTIVDSIKNPGKENIIKMLEIYKCWWIFGSVGIV